jgi:hypothetical protein
VDWPATIGGQPRLCARVGPPGKDSENHLRTQG